MPWLPYRSPTGVQLPMVEGKLVRGGDDSWLLDFLVDSGASYSIVSRVQVAHLIKDLAQDPVDSGARGANGEKLVGIPVEFEVVFPDQVGIPRTLERFWVCSGVKWTLLGQTWFEKLAVRFHNFPAARHGRQFQVHLR